ncbi:hypothetical protein AAC387_Pa08g1912 [Persea americana]
MMDLLQTRLTFHFYCACEHHLKCVFKSLQRTRWINSSSAQLSCTPTLRDLFEKILIEWLGKLAFRVARVSIYRPKVVLGSFTSCGINNRNLRGNWRELSFVLKFAEGHFSKALLYLEERKPAELARAKGFACSSEPAFWLRELLCN